MFGLGHRTQVFRQGLSPAEENSAVEAEIKAAAKALKTAEQEQKAG